MQAAAKINNGSGQHEQYCSQQEQVMSN